MRPRLLHGTVILPARRDMAARVTSSITGWLAGWHATHCHGWPQTDDKALDPRHDTTDIRHQTSDTRAVAVSVWRAARMLARGAMASGSGIVYDGA
jgi:hypothetical protein